MDNIIEIKNVSFNYTEDDKTYTVLKNINLSIEKGSFTVILGHNGSGKSTLAKLMNGLYKPDGGEVFVNGINTKDEKNGIRIKSTVGMVFQNPDNQIVASIVEDDVAFGPENLGLSPEESRKRVDNALKTVDMYDYRKSTPHNLSGGQKQRIAIAGVIAMEPSCIVLDEPTAMLDPKGRKDIIKYIEKLNRENNITIVLITHFMEEAENADRVILLSDGSVIADDKPQKIFSDIKLLKSIGLDVPQTTELLYSLSSVKKVDTKHISIEDTADEIISAFHLEEK
ncbi:MAG: energy-coupling factor transporter ATPase [Clostridia bacterium]|nr:energy-coupling factor transporter ATPase [Clostridia bacterium]